MGTYGMWAVVVALAWSTSLVVGIPIAQMTPKVPPMMHPLLPNESKVKYVHIEGRPLWKACAKYFLGKVFQCGTPSFEYGIFEICCASFLLVICHIVSSRYVEIDPRFVDFKLCHEVCHVRALQGPLCQCGIPFFFWVSKLAHYFLITSKTKNDLSSHMTIIY
jgi:hypothetical protein